MKEHSRAGNVGARRVATCVLALCLIAACGLRAGSAADETTSETDQQLATWLQQYPQADADGDGILTFSEASAYREKLAERQGGVRREEEASRLAPVRAPNFADVKYGPYKRNVLDFWRADSEEPTPVLLYFHGGGFVGGDKRAVGGYVGRCLPDGISVASANYRFVRREEAATFPGPHRDGARAVQFLRFKAGEWNIDPDRIALAGGSAGANISLWIALHDDLADPDSEDPIARLSTRVSCVLSSGGQTSNDPRFILKHIGGSPDVHPSLFPAYGIQSWDELDRPEIRKVVEESSAINHATRDDPPIYLRYGGQLAGTPLPENTPIGVSIHHPKFGQVLKEKLDALGVECHLFHKEDPPPRDGDMAFLKKHLKVHQRTFTAEHAEGAEGI